MYNDYSPAPTTCMQTAGKGPVKGLPCYVRKNVAKHYHIVGTFERENVCKFCGFGAISESFLHEILGHTHM